MKLDEKETKEYKNSLLADLLGDAPKPIDLTCEVTAPMLAEHSSMDEHTWSDNLRRREKAGELVSRWAMAENGHRVRAYRRKT